ncbi:hypothetical protein IV203_032123 [Nitzschia inconspicua]|uniref:Uncharacterized protein n=1 Tax=Nitzschia inconspicua TaxID=303405 RepID=A0A9K3LVN1_9STRA|nr:hypothetical protein IV203_032123 [Nitzschia inconspicua]
MGCGGSKHSGLQTVDDSVHVMLTRDRKVQKAKGQTPHGYVPRAEHPLLKQKAETAAADADPDAPDDAGPTAPAANEDHNTGAPTNNNTTTTTETK